MHVFFFFCSQLNNFARESFRTVTYNFCKDFLDQKEPRENRGSMGKASKVAEEKRATKVCLDYRVKKDIKVRKEIKVVEASQGQRVTVE